MVGWTDGWMGGWMGVRAGLRIANSNGIRIKQKSLPDTLAQFFKSKLDNLSETAQVANDV